MQTFLPYSSFADSARSLDYRRLGKQRVECLQILNTLTSEKPGGWRNHPAVKMWRGAESGLCFYALHVCDEWIRRGYKDTCRAKISAILNRLPYKPIVYPPWLGNEDFHRSHRANLVKKDPTHYVPLFGDLPWEPYVWPVGGQS
jgi:hypothetical protein